MFTRTIRTGSVLIGILILLTFSVGLASARTSLEITSTRLESCSQTSYIASMRISWELEDGDRIYYGTVEPDGTSSLSLSSLNNRTSPKGNWTIGYNFAQQTYPYVTRFWYFIRKSGGEEIDRTTVEVVCTGPNEGYVYVLGSWDGEYVQPDERINWLHGDFNAVAYSEPDENGDMRLILYCYDDTTQTSTLGFVVEPEDVRDLEPVSENTLLFEAPQCGAYFYYLTSGEFQLNVVTTYELYEMIDTDLDFHDATRRRSRLD